MIFSFSRLKLYETCPYRFRQKYIKGRDEPVTLPLALGKAVHKAIEEVINGTSHSEAVLKGLEEADFHPEVKKDEVEKLIKNAPIREGMGETEVYFRFPLSNSSSAPEIQGYVDLVSHEGNEIVDWKTNRGMYGILDNHQVALYAWAVQQLKKVEMVRGRLAFIRFKKEYQYTFDRETTEQARRWALKLANEINSKLFLLEVFPKKSDEIFPATPSSACSYCPFSVECFRKFSPFSSKK